MSKLINKISSIRNLANILQTGAAPAREMPPIPTGWFVVGLSQELVSGQLISKRFAGHDVVLFRTESGKAGLLDAYCPHLGAHMGHGGEVCGEALQCPFHHFQFDTEGVCVKTGYNRKPPTKAKARRWPVVEQNGLILAWHDPVGADPLWSVPPLDETHWRPLMFKRWELPSHPQETSENSVDLGHFIAVHGYYDIETIEPMRIDGAVLSAKYRMSRDAGFVGMDSVRIALHIQVHGLGYSLVEVHIETLDMRTRHLVLSTPIERGRIELRAGFALYGLRDRTKMPLAARVMPRGFLEWIVSWTSFFSYQHDIKQDFDIWANKRHIKRPPLAAGDGPIGPYRKYVRQFYPKNA